MLYAIIIQKYQKTDGKIKEKRGKGNSTKKSIGSSNKKETNPDNCNSLVKNFNSTSNVQGRKGKEYGN